MADGLSAGSASLVTLCEVVAVTLIHQTAQRYQEYCDGHLVHSASLASQSQSYVLCQCASNVYKRSVVN